MRFKSQQQRQQQQQPQQQHHMIDNWGTGRWHGDASSPWGSLPTGSLLRHRGYPCVRPRWTPTNAGCIQCHLPETFRLLIPWECYSSTTHTRTIDMGRVCWRPKGKLSPALQAMSFRFSCECFLYKLSLSHHFILLWYCVIDQILFLDAI